VAVAAGQRTATFPITTSSVSEISIVVITASYLNVSLTARLHVIAGIETYCTDFASGAGQEWSISNTQTLRGEKYLGDLRNETARLSLVSLPPHTSMTVTYSAYVFGSWDGNNTESGPDTMKLKVQNGPTLFNTTFSAIGLGPQSFPADFPFSFPPTTGATGIDVLYSADSIYRINRTFPHTDNMVGIEFTTENLTDEFLGIDNVCVRLNSEPRLSSMTVDPQIIAGGVQSSTGTLRLTSAAPAVGLTFPVTSSIPAVLTVPPTVTVPQGQTTITFPVTTVIPQTDQNVTVSASHLGDMVSAYQSVIVPGPIYNIVQFSALPNAPVEEGTIVQLSATIRNDGTLSGTARVRFYYDLAHPANLIAEQTGVSMPPNGQVNISKSWDTHNFLGARKIFVQVENLSNTGNSPDALIPDSTSAGTAQINNYVVHDSTPPDVFIRAWGDSYRDEYRGLPGYSEYVPTRTVTNGDLDRSVPVPNSTNGNDTKSRLSVRTAESQRSVFMTADLDSSAYFATQSGAAFTSRGTSALGFDVFVKATPNVLFGVDIERYSRTDQFIRRATAGAFGCPCNSEISNPQTTPTSSFSIGGRLNDLEPGESTFPEYPGAVYRRAYYVGNAQNPSYFATAQVGIASYDFDAGVGANANLSVTVNATACSKNCPCKVQIVRFRG